MYEAGEEGETLKNPVGGAGEHRKKGQRGTLTSGAVVLIGIFRSGVWNARNRINVDGGSYGGSAFP